MDSENQHFRETPERVARFSIEILLGSVRTPRDESDDISVLRLATCGCFRPSISSLFVHIISLCMRKIHLHRPQRSNRGNIKNPRPRSCLASHAIVQESWCPSIADAFMSVVKPAGLYWKASQA